MSFIKALKAIEKTSRQAAKNQRKLEKRRREANKLQEIERAALEVELHKNHIEVIQSMHKEAYENINWQEVANQPIPEKPHHSDINEAKATSKRQNFIPNFIHQWFKLTEKKIAKLDQAISKAKQLDEQNYQKAVSKWEHEVKEITKEQSLAKRIIAGELAAKRDAIEKYNPFKEIKNVGSGLNFQFPHDKHIQIILNVHGKNIVPNEEVYQLKSGKLSSKKMKTSRFNYIYQDYVCSAVLRIANDFFALLEDDIVYINAEDTVINQETGHEEQKTILSACINRKKLHELNMEYIDPSRAMKNFQHNMMFNKDQGFYSVEPLKIKENSTAEAALT